MSSRTLQLDSHLHAYLVSVAVDEPDVARSLREETEAMPMARMQISPEQGQLMAWLVATLGVRRAIEVGTFTGYSALRMALELPADGCLLCCDVSEEYTSIARRYWSQAKLDERIQLAIGPAAETLAARIEAGELGAWDLAFVDADKPGYAGYLDQLHILLRQGGVVIIDNVLWGGSVADPSDVRASTVALRDLNEALRTDPRWHRAMIPIGDGLTLLRKR